MPRQVTAQGIANGAAVQQQVAIWTAEGAQVQVKDNGNGTSDVTATWPDPPAQNPPAGGAGGGR